MVVKLNSWKVLNDWDEMLEKSDLNDQKKRFQTKLPGRKNRWESSGPSRQTHRERMYIPTNQPTSWHWRPLHRLAIQADWWVILFNVKNDNQIKKIKNVTLDLIYRGQDFIGDCSGAPKNLIERINDWWTRYFDRIQKFKETIVSWTKELFLIAIEILRNFKVR